MGNATLNTLAAPGHVGCQHRGLWRGVHLHSHIFLPRPCPGLRHLGLHLSEGSTHGQHPAACRFLARCHDRGNRRSFGCGLRLLWRSHSGGCRYRLRCWSGFRLEYRPGLLGKQAHTTRWQVICNPGIGLRYPNVGRDGSGCQAKHQCLQQDATKTTVFLMRSCPGQACVQGHCGHGTMPPITAESLTVKYCRNLPACRSA